MDIGALLLAACEQEQAAAAAQASSATPLVPLLPETGEDQHRAALVKFKRKLPNNFEQSRIKKRVSLKAGSIFGIRSSAERKKLDALSKVRARGVDPSLFEGAAGAAAATTSRSLSARPKPSVKHAHIHVVRPKD